MAVFNSELLVITVGYYCLFLFVVAIPGREDLDS